MKYNRWVVGFVLLMTLTLTSTAQQTYSAVLTVIHEDVEVQRTGTTQWISLSSGTVMPFGPDDQLRTNAEGRALLTFEDAAEILVMPTSSYHLTSFEVTDTMTITADAEGSIIHRMAEDIDYTLHTANIDITTPAQHFAIWTEEATVGTAEGILSVIYEGTPITLLAQTGIQQFTIVDAEDFDLNPVKLRAAIADCSGTIQTDQNQNLLVRLGTATGYARIGAIPNGEPIALLGVTENNNWYRIQFRNNFGWIYAPALQANCAASLPRYSDDSTERLFYILSATPQELSLLEPFYGLPTDDGWFYRD